MDERRLKEDERDYGGRGEKEKLEIKYKKGDRKNGNKLKKGERGTAICKKEWKVRQENIKQKKMH